jgi:hypothetical protein
MTTKFQKNGISFAAALSTLSIFFQYASAAIFEFNIANAGESVGKPATMDRPSNNNGARQLTGNW